MNFKKLEIFGFKSFADKLEIKFDSGVTCIVGPNGCGKSNVADSVRWVLGEQSARLLRGNQMMDVIFNGTEQRKSLSYCEVSLFFDNSDKRFPIDYEEIVISRKLYRSGESEYSINRQACRLKDVLDLMRDCGVGKEGYSIIGQGRIDEILSARPEERRAVFEEACGISKFKAKKLESERKLERTNDNILRLNDILSEIERQLNPLKSQAEDAKVYLDLKEKLKIEEINNYIWRYESFNSTKSAIETRLKAIEDEYNMVQNEYENAFRSYQNLFVKMNNTDKEIDRLRNKQLSITVDIEKQAGQYNLLSERIQMLQKQNEQLKEQCGENLNYKIKLEKELVDLSAEIEQKRQIYAELSKESEELSSQYLETVNLIAKGEDDVEENRQIIIESLKRLSEIKSNLSSLLTERDVLSERLNGLLAEIISRNGEIDALSEKIKKTEQDIDALKVQKQELLSEKQDIAARYNETVKKRKSCEDEANGTQSEIAALKARLNYLISARDNFEGYVYSVKNLLKAKQHDNGLRFEGAVAQLIDVEEKYQTAIDVALGQAQQNIITLTYDDAKYLIGYLKKNNMGRVTFLPVDTVRGRQIEADILARAQKCRGFIGVADKLIKYNPTYANIMSGLLGKTIICDDLDNAAQIAREVNYTVKIVTLDGDVIHPYGAVSGGSIKKGSGEILSYDRNISEAEANLKQKQAAFGELTQKINDYNENCASLQNSLEKITEKLHGCDIELTRLGGEAEKSGRDIEEKRAGLNGLNAEREKCQQRLNYIKEELKTADELENKISQQQSSADDIRQEHKSRYDALRKKRDALHERATNIKVKMASLYTEIQGSENRINSIKEQIKQIEEDLHKANCIIEQNSQSIAAYEKDKSLVDFDTVSESELEEIKERLTDLDKLKQDIQNELSEADGKRSELSQRLQKISEKRIREESNLSKIDIDLDNMKDRIWEEYQVTYETSLDYRKADFNFSASNSEIASLKRKISALGYVNVNAIEDYKVLKQRYDELDEQVADLKKARDDLNKVIADLTNEMLERFTKGFEIIKRNFSEVFKELFGGGEARLELDTAETEDPLSAGIDIIAEPPGKRLQNVSLLSGGERAMTAIAILFAILKMRPMPFCVLDEIEAALDDVNAARFARYLKNFAQETQFIVITHRKPTMELADALYGVTMQEKGVSKIVSVKLSEALRTAEAV